MYGNKIKTNHLSGQTSPYLLQHVNNPVDWYPWGKEALEKAMKEDKPILVSIGYSACHWCHVMERESFEDDEVAQIMNENFVCIKVDREERPDIDHMYMTAVQLLTGQGGWPLNCFSLPDTRPFWGGTYFRTDQWKSVLEQVTELYNSRKHELVEQAELLTSGITDSSFIKPSDVPGSFQRTYGDNIFRNIMEHMDQEQGGTKGAPKFPLPVNLEFLLHYHYHSGKTNALEQVELSLEKMAMGGIYDQIGGGFARYSTDKDWKVPHFEKMLYDNGQLLSVYSNAWKVLKRPVLANVVYQTAGFLEREMTAPGGTFYSALDADSEGEEGKFYLWQEKEIDQVLDKIATVIKEYYQVGKKGLWENGENILLRDEPDDIFFRKRDIPADKFGVMVRNANICLLKTRSRRVRPALDNKVITSWNALAIKGLADAYAAFDDESFLLKAKRAANYLIKYSMTPEGKIHRSLTGTTPSIAGFLDDYAMFAEALIRLYEVSLETKYLLTAKSLMGFALDNFSHSSTSLLTYASANENNLKADFYEIPDNVIPSSNSVMAGNLLRLSNYFERSDWADRSLRMLADISPRLFENSISYANWGRMLLYNIYPFYTVVVCGPEARKKVKEINSLYIPGIIVAGTTSDDLNIPLFRNRFKEGETWFYVCSSGSCKQPVTDLHEALDQIK